MIRSIATYSSFVILSLLRYLTSFFDFVTLFPPRSVFVSENQSAAAHAKHVGRVLLPRHGEEKGLRNAAKQLGNT